VAVRAVDASTDVKRRTAAGELLVNDIDERRFRSLAVNVRRDERRRRSLSGAGAHRYTGATQRATASDQPTNQPTDRPTQQLYRPPASPPPSSSLAPKKIRRRRVADVRGCGRAVSTAPRTAALRS